MLRRRTGKPEDLRALKILIQIYLEPMGGEGELTTFGDVYRAVGVNPADRQCRCRFRRALLELKRDRQTEILLPLCVLLRDAEHNEFVQRLGRTWLPRTRGISEADRDLISGPVEATVVDALTVGEPRRQARANLSGPL